MIPDHLAPMIGPRNTIGRMIAGEKVPQADMLADTSELIRVYVDRDIQTPQQAAIGFLVQCAICPQRAVLHLQPPGEWVCPRCTEIAAPPEPEHSSPVGTCSACRPADDGAAVDMPQIRLADRYPAPAPDVVDQIESVTIGRHAKNGAATAREFIDGLITESWERARGRHGDTSIDQAEHDDWPTGQVTG